MNTKIKLLYVVMIALVIFTLWPSEETNHEQQSGIKVWNAHIDNNGQLNVLDVVLGKSTLKQAETVLRSQSERALFIKVRDEVLQGEVIEAYFPTSPDRAKLVIELDASADLIKQVKTRAYKTMVFPSGNAKVEISPADMPVIEQLVAKSITYIPPITLEAELIEKQFGKAEQQIRDSDANLHLLYPALGLDAVLPREGKTMLQFVPPAEFNRLLDLITTAPEPGVQ